MRDCVQVATARLGLILVNLSPAYTSSELSHALKLTGCKAVVTQIGQPPQGGEYPFMSILREVCVFVCVRWLALGNRSPHTQNPNS